MNTHEIKQTIARIVALIDAHPEMQDAILRRDMIEGETDYAKVLERLSLGELRMRRQCEADRAIAREFSELASKRDAAADDLREMMIALMQAAGAEKERLPSGALLSLSTTKPAPIVTDASAVPIELCKIEPSLSAIRKWIEDNQGTPPGVSMSNGRPSLRITR